MSDSRARVRSRFAVSGFSCPTHLISETLGITPDRTSDIAPDRSGYKYWEILAPEVDSLAIEDHISALIDKLRPAAEALKSPLFDNSDMERNILISIDRLEEGSKPHLVLLPEQSEFLTRYGVTLVLDMM